MSRPDWQDDPERFVKPDPFITDRDPGDETDFPCGPGCIGDCDDDCLVENAGYEEDEC